jgi:hypothetical protein
VERRGERRVAVANQQPEAVDFFVEVHQQVAGLLSDPGAGRVSGDPGQMHPPPLDLDDEPHLQPSQANVVDGEQITRQRSLAPGAQKLIPGRPTAAGSRAETMSTQDPLHRRRRHPNPDAATLPHRPRVPPAGVLPRRPHNQTNDLPVQPAGTAAGVRKGPVAVHQLPCQRSSVDGVTRNTAHRFRRSNLAKVASSIRSAGVYRGRATWRLNTTS